MNTETLSSNVKEAPRENHFQNDQNMTEDEKIKSEKMRRERAIYYGLPEDASWEEINQCINFKILKDSK